PIREIRNPRAEIRRPKAVLVQGAFGCSLRISGSIFLRGSGFGLRISTLRRARSDAPYLSPFQARYIGAIHAVREGAKLAGMLEFKTGLGCQESTDHCAIFFGLETAGAVDQSAARFEQSRGPVQEVYLGRAQSLDFVGLNPPAQVDATPHDASIRA